MGNNNALLSCAQKGIPKKKILCREAVCIRQLIDITISSIASCSYDMYLGRNCLFKGGSFYIYVWRYTFLRRCQDIVADPEFERLFRCQDIMSDPQSECCEFCVKKLGFEMYIQLYLYLFFAHIYRIRVFSNSQTHCWICHSQGYKKKIHSQKI